MSIPARRALVDAARELLTSHSPTDIPARAIAERAGVTYGLVSYYFGTRERLLLTAITELRAERMAKVEALGSAEDALDMLVADYDDPYMQMVVHKYADLEWCAALREDPERLAVEVSVFAAMYRKLGFPDGLAARGALSALHLGWVLCNRTEVAAFEPGSPDHAPMVEYLRLMVRALAGAVASG